MHFNNSIKLWCWLLILSLAITYLITRFNDGIKLESNIIKLLPTSEQQANVQNAVDTVTKNIGQKTVFLIGNKNKTEALKAAELFYKKLNASNLFSQITYSFESSKLQKLYSLYLPYKNQLLSRSQKEQLQNKNYSAFTQQALQKIYNPLSPLSSEQLENDPFFSLMDFLQKQNTLKSSLYLDNNHLMTKYKNQYFVFISSDLKNDTYALNTQKKFKTFYNDAKSQIKNNISNTKILSMGAIHYTIEGTDSAKKEISTIGLGSLLGIIILILIVFRSVTPLILSIVSISSGVATGLAACLYFFNEIHIFTLVFGSSLIGVSIDYSFHYFSERLNFSGDSANDNTANKKTIQHIFPAISMGMLSSVLAYMALAASPFPGLQQISVFSMIGLITAYGCVIFLYPAVNFKNTPSSASIVLKLAQPVLNKWKNINKTQLHLFIIFSVSIFSSVLFFNLQSDDNIRNLHNRPEKIAAEEALVKEAIRTNTENQFYLIQGETAEAVLQNEERLYSLLDSLISNNTIEAYQGSAIFSPSAKRQLENHKLLKDAINSNDPALKNYLLNIGYSDDKIQKLISNLNTLPTDTFNIEKWLATDLSSDAKFHWSGKLTTENAYQSIVTLYGIHDLEKLKSLKTPNDIIFVDYVDDISNTLKTYREHVNILIFSAYLFIFIILCFRYGWYKSIFIITPPLLAALSALLIAMSIGIKVNYFNSLAVILILGIGIDYSLFYAENKTRAEFTMLAILLSAITTILAFGLLALSNTPALHSFGIIVLVGISVAFLLSPMAGLNSNKSFKNNTPKRMQA